MPDNNTNIPMNNGNFPNDNLASIITQQLDSNFSSITSQLKAITDALKESIKIQKDSSKQQTTGGQSDDRKVDKSLRDVLNSIASYSRDLKRTVSQVGSSIQTMTEELEDATEAIESSNKKDASKYLREEQRKMKQQEKENLEKIQELIKKAQEGTKDASGNVIDVGIKSLEEDVGELQEKLKDTTLSEEKRLEIGQKLSNVSEELERRYRDLSSEIDRETAKNEEAQRARKKQLAEFEKRIGAVNSGLEGLKNKSPYLNNNVKNEEDEEDPVKEMKELIEAQKKLIQNANEAIRKEKDNLDAEKRNIELEMQQLDDSTEENKKKKDEYKKRLEIIEQNRNNLTHQEEVNNKQLETLGKWNPVRDALSKVADSFKDSLKKLKDFAVDRLENYFLTSYKEGFERVYQSIENTRNTISARLKLSQGEYSDLQADIQDMIESAGMQGTITQSEVNDAIASLQGAGVTDTEVLKTLAFEQAKLKASGSSFDLSNEESLQQMREYIHNQMSVYGMSEEEAVKSYTNILDNMAAAQAEIGSSGWDATFVNGALNTLANQVFDTANAMQKSGEETIKDIYSAMSESDALHEIGLDPSTLYQYIKDLRDGTVASNSAFEKALNNLGIDREAVLTKGYGELSSEISKTLKQVVDNTDERYIPEISETWGLGLTTTQLLRLKNNELNVKEISQDQIDARKADTEKALQDSKYQSATLTHQKEAENSMAEIAIHAEKIYEGDKWVMAGFDAVEGILKTIRSSIEDVISTMWKSGVGNTVSGTFSNMSGSDVSNFMFGKSGTKAGNIGKGLGVAAGVGIMGVSVVQDIKESETAKEAAERIFTDPSFYGGLGTSLGSAIAGPVGGAIGGAIGTAVSMLGNKIGDWIAEDSNPLADAADALSESANQQIEAANQQIESAKNQMSEYESWGKEQKKLYLVDNGLLTKQIANSLSEKEINDKFNEMVIKQQQNIVDEQKNIIAQQELVKKQALDATNFNDFVSKQFEYGDIEAYNKTMSLTGSQLKAQASKSMSEEDYKAAEDSWVSLADELKESGATEKELETAMKDFWSKQGPNAEVVGRYQEAISTATKNYAGMMGGAESASLIMQDLSGMKEKTDDQLAEYLKATGNYTDEEISSMSRDDMVKASIVERQKERGITDIEAQNVELKVFEDWQTRKEKYEEADEKFHSKWDKFVRSKGIDPKSNLQEALSAYAVENLDDGYGSGFISGAYMDESGVVHIDNDKGWYKDNYVERHHFKTGLTEVPADDYPALLHKGERVLTKEEASVYNKLSSYAVDQIVNNSKSVDSSMSAEEAYSNLSSYAISQIEENVYNKLGSTSPLSTTAYGNFDNLETSINNQTSSLSDILNQILAAIQNLATYSGLYGVRGNASKVRQNVLKGNSNITQINTL